MGEGIDNVKSLMRNALSSNPQRSRTALVELNSISQPLPPPFTPHLLGFATTTENRTDALLCINILKRLLPNAPRPPTIEKAKSSTVKLLKCPANTRHALSSALVACALMEQTDFCACAINLLVAAVVALERISVPDRGCQHRSKSKTAKSLYSHVATTAVSQLSASADLLFNNADRYAKEPLQAVAAIALLSLCYSRFTSENKLRLLICASTLCVKVPSHSKRIIEVCSNVFEGVQPSHVTGKVIPLIEKSLIREPEKALYSASFILQALGPLDISIAVTNNLLPPLVQSMKSTEEIIRKGGIALAGAIGLCVFNEASAAKVVTDLVTALKGSRYVYQRLAVYEALNTFTSKCQFFSKAHRSLLDSLRTWLETKKETKEEARFCALNTLVLAYARMSTQDTTDAKSKSSLQECSKFILSVLDGKTTESDQRAILIAVTSCHKTLLIPEDVLGASARAILVSTILNSVSKTNKQDIALHALTILCDWSMSSRGKENGICPLPAKVQSLIGDPSASPALADPKSFSSSTEAISAVRCCTWMIESEHNASTHAMASLLRLCLDERNEVHNASVKVVQSWQKRMYNSVLPKLFTVFWETQFSGKIGESSVARSYYFDDNMISAERLGSTLLSFVLPNVVTEHIPHIALTSNHPRLRPYTRNGCPPRGSRYWDILERRFESIDPDANVSDDCDDWLEKCLAVMFGKDGLQSQNEAMVTAAVSSLAAICDERNDYSMRALRASSIQLRYITTDASNLSEEAFEAMKVVQEADESNRTAEGALETSAKGNTKKPGSKQSTQEKQARADRARAAKASASAIAEKVENMRALAKATKISLYNARNALLAISAIARAAVKGSHNLMSKLLPIVIPLIKYETLEQPCREALSALCNCVTERLRNISDDISSCLYGLERGGDVDEQVSSIIFRLKENIPPALSAEDFVLVAPIIRAALGKDPSTIANGGGVGRQGASKRRDAVALVKTAAQILLSHCSPEAVDAAVSAAAVSAGSWLIAVMEREDGAFAVAADALALLTGTALTPGTAQLNQTVEGIYSGKSSVRDATLGSLARLPPLSSPNIGCPRDSGLGRALWLARFDPDETNSETADELWENYGHPLHPPDDVPVLMKLLCHKESDIRVMSAKAIAYTLEGSENDETRSTALAEMVKNYSTKLPKSNANGNATGIRRGVPPPVKRGREKSKDDPNQVDKGWESREGIALALEQMAIVKCMASVDIEVSFSFLAKQGLGDENDTVRAKMAKAAVTVVEAAGSLGPTLLLPLIERQLNTEATQSMSKEEILHADRTRENLVMCLGSVASFLPPDDPRVIEVSDQVMKSAMETPSEVVQNAAARCLSSLASVAIKGEREIEITKMLLSKLWNKTSSYGQRRGAAYSLGGISGGLGLRYVKRAMLKDEIDSAFAEKSPWKRQGAFILIETSAIMMGRVFEPYLVTIVPFLLSCMSDSVVDVRNACWAASQAAMSELSSQGVKMVLPSLLEGLADRQWRTRAGSAEVLGAMAYCAPRQLAQCLPQVVPKLADALADAHPNVVESAESAINRIAAVVRSPEVRKLSPFLLAALRDPSGRTRGAVDAMLGSEFVHAIDAASLSLLIPPLHRGLRDRSFELKKRSAAIVGSMCNNVSNPTDVVPYLGLLLPALRTTLLDAIPDVRRTSSRALGALAVSLGEKGLADLIPWLTGALLGGVKANESWTIGDKVLANTVSSSAERSGAAMGLAEVSASMSEKRLEEVISRVLAAGRSSAEAREGGLMLIASMPRALGERFEGRIGISLAAILQGLADDADSVREAALEAGRNLVSAYAKTSLERLMPELLRAMREKLWRIRQAATRLLGDMLLVIAGARPDRPDIYGSTDSAGNDEELKEDSEDGEDGEENGEGEDGEDEDGDEDFESPEDAAAALTVEAAMKTIEEVLGMDRRNEVLAALYIARCDVSVRVRQTAMQVWKSVVSNTPRVLREIMPSAVRQIVDGLGDEDEERRGAAGKTLGDLAQKLGDHVVPEVLPALRSGISSKDNSDRIRKGACEGLGELVFACPKQQLETYADNFIDAVHQGLSDELVEVRRSAADVFASLLKPLGTTAVDSIVPRLIDSFSREGISSNDSEVALDGLSQILRSCGARLTSIVVPRLFEETPLSAAACKVLATAATVSGSTFEPYVIDLTEAVVDSMEEILSTEVGPLDEVLAALSSCGDECVRVFSDHVISKFNEGYSDRRIAAARVLQIYARAANRTQILASAITLLEVLIRQLSDTDEGAALAAWMSWNELCESIGSAAMSQHIPIIRQSLRAASSGIIESDSSILLGLQVPPKSLGPFVPIVTEGLLNGVPELKEQAALCISELSELVTPKILAPFVIKLTGPLIRSLTGRVPWQVKAAILKSLHGLIKNGTTMIRSFVPQLQGSFVKNLSDGSRMVRVRSCTGLAAIIPLQNRLEPLLNDLVALGLNGLTAGPRSAAFRGCSQVFRLGKKLPENLAGKYGSKLCEGLMDEDEEVWRAAGKCIGLMAERSASRDQYCMLLEMVQNRLSDDDIEMNARISIAKGLGAVMKAGMEVKDELSFDDVESCAADMMNLMSSTIPQIRIAAASCIGDMLIMFWHLESVHGCNRSGDYWKECVMRLGDVAEMDDNSDVRISAIAALRDIVHREADAFTLCADNVVAGAGATNTGIREETEKLIRSAFFNTGEDEKDKDKVVIDERRLVLAKEALTSDDAQFLERKVRKLALLRMPDEEKEI